MKMNRRSGLVAMLMFAICIMAAAPARASAILISTQGVFSDPNAVFEQSFVYNPVTMGDTLVIQTLGYGGSANGDIFAATGRNLAGVIIPAGGFDPIVALYAGGAGGGGARLDFDDDGTCGPRRGTTHMGICFDSTLVFSSLAAGTYTVALTVFPNFPPATETGTYGSGAANFNGRTANFALDVAAVTTVPEPASLTLFGTGVAALLARRRKSRTAKKDNA